MGNFLKIAEGIDVTPILLELDRNDLWNKNTDRKCGPHEDMDDIWVRFRAVEELTSPDKYRDPHFAMWYPAFYKLPSLRPLLFAIMARTQAVYLGGVLITRIPPGGLIEPHKDSGWHAEFHNCKVYVPLRSNERCFNRCEEESVSMKAGEVWTFNNLRTHSVENKGAEARITLIVSMRCE